MRKLTLLLAFVLSATLLFSQAVTGGAGVCAVSDDPDNITEMQTQDGRYECLVAWDNTNQSLYVYDSTATSGNRWTSVPLSTVTDTDTRLDNPRVTGGNLVFDLYDETTDTDIGDISVPVIDIAPVQDVVAGTGISVGNVGGTFTVTNTAPANSTDELQTISNSFPNATTARITLSDGGGDVDLVEGASITLQNDGSGNIEVINDAPDQTVTIANGSGITVSGSYPSFTVTNTGDLSDSNEAQTISSSFPTASTATWSLDQVGGAGGGTITLEEGNGVDITNNGGNIQVTNTEFAANGYADHAAAGVGGVAIGEYFYATSTNTMGVPAGTKIRRAF